MTHHIQYNVCACACLWERDSPVLTWPFGSTPQNTPQAEDNGSLILLDDLHPKKPTKIKTPVASHSLI